MRSRTTFKLGSGRIIQLLALDQHYTYEGLLAGLPTREMNQDMMDRLVRGYTRPEEYGTPPLLKLEQQPFGIPERVPVLGTRARLPSVTCIARFDSDGQLGTDDIWSVLRVIWFQDEFAFPIGKRVLQQIDAIDWETHAKGWLP